MVLRCVRASRARELCYEIIHFNSIKNFFLLLNTLRKSGLQSHNLQKFLLFCYFPSENLVFSPTAFSNDFFVHIFKKFFEQGGGGGGIFKGMPVNQTVLRATTKSKD